MLLPQIGHNPSEHAWHTGHYYSNPSNRMWRILEASGDAVVVLLLPSTFQQLLHPLLSDHMSQIPTAATDNDVSQLLGALVQVAPTADIMRHRSRARQNHAGNVLCCYILAGITPAGVSGPEADDVMPAAVGVGFTDVGSGQPGTDR